MNRRINPHNVPVDENSDSSEFRLKLSNHSYRFLTVVVRDNEVTASFEEEEVGKSSSQSFFLYKDGQVIRCKGSYIASFSFHDNTYHLYGHATRQ